MLPLFLVHPDLYSTLYASQPISNMAGTWNWLCCSFLDRTFGVTELKYKENDLLPHLTHLSSEVKSKKLPRWPLKYLPDTKLEGSAICCRGSGPKREVVYSNLREYVPTES